MIIFFYRRIKGGMMRCMKIKHALQQVIAYKGYIDKSVFSIYIKAI